MMRLLALSWRNLKRNFRRNLATGIAIGFGFAALVALVGYMNRADNFIRVYTIYAGRVGHLTIMPHDALDWYAKKPAAYSFTVEQQAKINEILAQIPDKDAVMPMLRGNGLLGNGCKTVPFQAVGIIPEIDRELRVNPEFTRWNPFKSSGVETGRPIWEYPPELSPIMLASGLARILHKEKLHDAFEGQPAGVVVIDCLSDKSHDQIASDANVQFAAATWDGNLTALDGEVVATYNPGSSELANAAVTMRLSHMQKLYETDHVSHFAIWLHDMADTKKYQSFLQTSLKGAGLNVDVFTWEDEAINPFYAGTIRFMRVMVYFIGLILICIVVFSIFNTATITALERVQEMGMMRSLGFTRAHLRTLFVLEATWLTIVSLVMGGALALGTIAGVNAMKIKYYPPGVAGGINLMLVPNSKGVALAALLVVFSGLIATLLATRTLIGKKITEQLMGHQR